jgi:hypothetical protein
MRNNYILMEIFILLELLIDNRNLEGIKMITETDEIFDISSRVTIHDIHQFEIKLEYNLEDLAKTR